MKWLGLLAVVGALVAACGCGQKETVVRLTEAPEVDHSAIDEYVEFENAEIMQGGLMVMVSGKAKVALGQGVMLKIDRFKGGALLDTINGRISKGKGTEIPGGVGAEPSAELADPAAAPPGPPPGMEAIQSIEPGDPVQIVIDATIEEGKISKLVIKLNLRP